MQTNLMTPLQYICNALRKTREEKIKYLTDNYIIIFIYKKFTYYFINVKKLHYSEIYMNWSFYMFIDLTNQYIIQNPTKANTLYQSINKNDFHQYFCEFDTFIDDLMKYYEEPILTKEQVNELMS